MEGTNQENNLLIIGAGDLGQVIAEMASESKLYQRISFLDDSREKEEQCDFPILGRTDSLPMHLGEFRYAIPAFGNNGLRHRFRLKLKQLGFELPVIVHPSAVISSSAMISPGVVIREGVCVSRKVIIEEGCLINMGVMIDHCCVIGEDTHIPIGCIIRNNVHISSMTELKPGQLIQ